MESTTKSEKRSWWVRLRSGIVIAVSVLTMFGMFFGGFQYIDTTYAKDHQVVFLGYKIDVKILDDRVHDLQERVWSLQDRLAESPVGSSVRSAVKTQLREATATKERLDAELRVVIEKYKQAEEKH